MKKSIKLSAWAKQHSYTYRGAFGLYKRGKLVGAYQTPSGAILVELKDEQTENSKNNYTVVYARVSSAENRENLDSQALRVSQFCNANGWQVDEVVKECASGLNDARPKLEAIFRKRKATRLIVEHKDRLTRFGFNYICALYPECEIVVINKAIDDKADIMSDFIALITSFCARIYGNRRTKRKTEKLIQELTKND